MPTTYSATPPPTDGVGRLEPLSRGAQEDLMLVEDDLLLVTEGDTPKTRRYSYCTSTGGVGEWVIVHPNSILHDGITQLFEQRLVAVDTHGSLPLPLRLSQRGQMYVDAFTFQLGV